LWRGWEDERVRGGAGTGERLWDGNRVYFIYGKVTPGRDLYLSIHKIHLTIKIPRNFDVYKTYLLVPVPKF
jgi:hypothetical protein